MDQIGFAKGPVSVDVGPLLPSRWELTGPGGREGACPADQPGSAEPASESLSHRVSEEIFVVLAGSLPAGVQYPIMKILRISMGDHILQKHL